MESLAAIPSNIREVVRRKVLNPVLSTGYLLKEYLRRRSLDEQIAFVLSSLESHKLGITSDDPGVRETLEKAVTLRRVDGLIYLHRSMRAWLIPHVASTSLMLALMVVHILQVVYFAVR